MYPPSLPQMAPAQKQNSILHIGLLIGLLAVLYGLLVYFNILSCSSVHPAVCDFYYDAVAGGKPKVLIVTGTDGMGNPQELYGILRSPKFNARVYLRELDVISLPMLREYQLVIVERARTMSIADMRLFMDYVNRGGRLIWVGDAAAAAPAAESDTNYFLLYGERKIGASTNYIGPWARRDANSQVSLDLLLGVNYRANYCELASCNQNEVVGNLKFEEGDKKYLVNGLADSLPFYGDFAIVVPDDSTYHVVVSYLDYGTQFTTSSGTSLWLKDGQKNLGREFPVIVSSGIGGRVAYYSFAPEYVVSGQMPLDKDGRRIAYWGIIENMYYGMLYR